MNIIGLSELMNPQYVDSGKDPTEIERQLTGRSGSVVSGPPTSEKEIQEELSIELSELMRDYGLSGSEDEEPEEEVVNFRPEPSKKRSSPPPDNDGTAFGSQTEPMSDPLSLTVESLVLDPLNESSSDDSEGDEGSSDSDDDDDSSDEESAGSDYEQAMTSGMDTAAASKVLQDIEKTWGIDLSEESFAASSSIGQPTLGTAVSDIPRRRPATEEETHKEHIESVLGGLRQETRTTFSMQHDREQDLKASKLEQIEQLKETLREDGFSAETIATPNIQSSMEEIDVVLRTLRHKNDRHRCSSLAEEVVLGAAEMVEYAFDGTTVVPFTNYKPNYSGYHNTVLVKLHRMRHETATVVSNIVQHYDIGPMARILIELIPSLLMYPRQQQQQKMSPGLHQDPALMPRVGDARGAYTAIRSRDERQTSFSKSEKERLLKI